MSIQEHEILIEIIAYPSWHSQPGFEDILNVRSQIVDVVAVVVAVAVVVVVASKLESTIDSLT